jgi:hypothetical protein
VVADGEAVVVVTIAADEPAGAGAALSAKLT